MGSKFNFVHVIFNLMGQSVFQFEKQQLLVVFSHIFVVVKKVIFRYDSLAPQQVSLLASSTFSDLVSERPSFVIINYEQNHQEANHFNQKSLYHFFASVVYYTFLEEQFHSNVAVQTLIVQKSRGENRILLNI